MIKPNRPEAFVLTFLVMVLLFALTGFLAKAYQSERRNRAESHFQAGEALAHAGQSRRAVEEYRAALTYSHNDRRYELSLSLALIDLGQLDEAEAHLIELREAEPNNALVNLMLARIAAREKRSDDAVACYNRAIYGLWPDNPEQNRIQTRFELVDLLGRTSQTRQALGQLLSLAAEAPAVPAVQNRIAALLLHYGSPQHAAEVFRAVLESKPRNARAAFGLAQSEFYEGSYDSAEQHYRRALRLDPANTQAEARIQEITGMRGLDPTLVTLRASQRYQRSLALIRLTSGALESCLGSRTPPPDVQAMLQTAQNFLKTHPRHREGDTPEALSLCAELWKARETLCGKLPEDALSLVMTKVTR